MTKNDASPVSAPPGRRPWILAAFLVVWALAAGGALTWLGLSRSGGEASGEDSWLHAHAPATAPVPPARPEAPRGGVMPRFRLTTMDGEATRLWEKDAPAVVTEWLAFCPDCEASAQLFPRLAERVVAAGEQVVNVAYRGQPRQVASYLKGRDFGGPTLLDGEGEMQRHFGIGTFTVWLLDRDGSIRFQGPPAAAEPHLEEHLVRRSRTSPPPD